MAYAIAAYLHFVAIFLLFALLVLEHQLFRLPLNFKRARSLFRVYYLNNSFFHAKIGLFVAVALLSIFPTVTFLRWRPALKAGQVPLITPTAARWVKGVIRIELLALLLLPLLATLMARGFGVRPL